MFKGGFTARGICKLQRQLFSFIVEKSKAWNMTLTRNFPLKISRPVAKSNDEVKGRF